MGGLSEAEKVGELLRLITLIDEKPEPGLPLSGGMACRGGSSDREAADARHRSYLRSLPAAVGESYSDDGAPALFVFRGNGGNMVCGYRWVAPEALLSASIAQSVQPNGARRLEWSKNYQPVDWSRVKGVLVHAHGITESARTGLLRCRATETVLGSDDHLYTQEPTEEEQRAMHRAVVEDNGYFVVYAKSWVERLTAAGYVVYAIDHQGHGFSQGWKGQRCNVERMEYMECDFLDLIRSLVLTKEVPQTLDGSKTLPSIPLFVSGLSMGGLVAARALQIGFERGIVAALGGQVSENGGVPLICGLCLLCPAISGERLKKRFPNQILLPLSRILSTVSPSMRLVALQHQRRYPFLNAVIERDPFVYSSKLPIRISAECVSEMDEIIPNAHHLPAELSVLLIQSKYDTMTDPEGSAAFVATVASRDKQVHWLDYSWHWLAREPGYGATCSQIIRWLDQQVDGLKSGV